MASNIDRKDGKPVFQERRSGGDRRVSDQPGKVLFDRRRGIEPRSPEVEELQMSISEWGALSEGKPRTPKR